jgi:glyceraldehyde 3-phosphate dehydrogenase
MAGILSWLNAGVSSAKFSKRIFMARVAINGFGRIGRNALRAYLTGASKNIEIVAINDPLQDLEQSAHLLKYDSILGELPQEVSHTQDSLVVGGKSIQRCLY